MIIRKGSLSDLYKIAYVESECFPAAEAASAEDFKNRLLFYPNHFWVIENKGEIIGFINGMCSNTRELHDEMYSNAALHDEGGEWQMIFGVDILPEYRGRGCARLLLKYMIADAKSSNRTGLILTCKDKLRGYYAKFGFKDEGISDSTHGGATWHKMRLIL